MNGAWNLGVACSTGDLIVFCCDWTWFGPDALSRLWAHYEQDPNVGVSSIGHNYGRLLGGVPVEEVSADLRAVIIEQVKTTPSPPNWPMAAHTEGLMPILWEQAFCSVSKEAFVRVGGMDEEYDRWCANSEKELAMRLYANGYRFLLDTSLEVRNFNHERMADQASMDRSYEMSRYQLSLDQHRILGPNPTKLRIPWQYGAETEVEVDK